MKERILRILQDKQLTSAKLADLITVQRSSISHIISGRNKPSMDFLEKILTSFSDISGDWLITGQGEMYKSGHTPNRNSGTTNNQEAVNYTSNLFRDATPGRDAKMNPQAKGMPSQPPLVSGSIQIQQVGKVVKRVVIYYDDNSYDELFLNK